VNTEFLLPTNHEQHRNTVTFEPRFRIRKYKRIRKLGIKQDTSNSCWRGWITQKFRGNQWNTHTSSPECRI